MPIGRASILFLLLGLGCRPSYSPPLKGVVLSNTTLPNSMILIGPRKADSGDTSVANARIRLFANAELSVEINIGEVFSDSAGDYEIDVNAIGESMDPNGFYYLVVEKPGYASLTYAITVGPRSPYVDHRVLLRKTP